MQQFTPRTNFNHSSTLCITTNNLTLLYKVFLEFFFSLIQYETIWTNIKLLTFFENIIVMVLQHIKTIIILKLSKIRNNSKFIKCAL